MSYKDGIPLLKSIGDPDSDEDEEFGIAVPSSGRRCFGRRCFGRRQICFISVLSFAILAILAIIAVVTVPVVLFRAKGGAGVVGGNSSALVGTSVFLSSPVELMSMASSGLQTSTLVSTVLLTPTPTSNVSTVVLTPTPTNNISSSPLSSIVTSSSLPPSVTSTSTVVLTSMLTEIISSSPLSSIVTSSLPPSVASTSTVLVPTNNVSTVTVTPTPSDTASTSHPTYSSSISSSRPSSSVSSSSHRSPNTTSTSILIAPSPSHVSSLTPSASPLSPNSSSTPSFSTSSTPSSSINSPNLTTSLSAALSSTPHTSSFSPSTNISPSSKFSPSTNISRSSNISPSNISSVLSSTDMSLTASSNRRQTVTSSAMSASIPSATPTPTTSAMPNSTSSATPPTTLFTMPTSTSPATPTATLLATPTPTTSAMPNSTSSATPPTTSFTMPTSTSPATPTATLLATPTPTTAATPTSTPVPPDNTTCQNDSGTCQSPTDRRSYRYVTLATNGLKVFLVSDPRSNVSAASMDVGVGSFSDLTGVDGLAHFCEHMLFLGTTKYPEESAYSGYLSTHGGYDNAFTSTQNTNYYFRVEAAYLGEALDRFAYFFISPLFNSSAVEREINAVNSEHKKNLQSDGWRLWQLLKSVSNPAHPFSKFSTGSTATLNKTDIIVYLWEYYRQYYSASKMRLVIYGNQPLSTLEQLAITSFAAVPSHPSHPLSLPTSTAFPSSDFTAKLVYYRPVADSNSLYISWQTMPLALHSRAAVSRFIARHVAHKGNGSVLSVLREKNWATDLSAGTELDANSFTLLFISVKLTEEGVRRVSDVMSAVFQYVRLLRGLSETECRVLWADFVSVSQAVYDYAAKEEPHDYAVSISQRMHHNDSPADFLGNPKRFLFNFTLLSQTLDSLTPDKTLVFVGSQHLHNNASLPALVNQSGSVPIPWPHLNETEPIYGTRFTRMSIPDNLMHFWGSDESFSGKLSLPAPNLFIPKDFAILRSDQSTGNTPSWVNLTEDVGAGVSLWWLQDREFQEPKMNFKCDFIAEDVHFSPQWTALTNLYLAMVTSDLQPTLYPALELAFSFKLLSLPRGFSLSAGGFSDPDQIEHYLETIASVLTNWSALHDSSVLFSRVLEEETQRLEVYNYTALPYQYTPGYTQRVVMERPFWKHWELLWAMKGVELRDVISHARQLFSNLSMVCFTHGNLNQEQAIHYTRIFAQRLSSCHGNSPLGDFPWSRVQLDPGNYSVDIPSLNPSDVNSVVNVVWQAGEVCSRTSEAKGCTQASLLIYAHLALLGEMVSDRCFDRLRTKEQLGYVVHCTYRVNQGVGSFQALVQSSSASPAHILSSIDAFFSTVPEFISSMDKTDFNEKVKVLKSMLRQHDLNLSDKNDRLWTEIRTNRNQFDYRRQVASALKNVSRDSLRAFVVSHILDHSSSQYRKLVIAVRGSGQTEASISGTHAMNYTGLSQNSSYFP